MSARKYGKEVAIVDLPLDRPAEPDEIVRELIPAYVKLFDHWEIERGDWQTLALFLAVEGGFLRYQARKGTAGRPKAWSPRELVRLWAKVRLLRLRNPSLSEAAACAHLGEKSGHKGLRQQLARGKKLPAVEALTIMMDALPRDAQEAGLGSLAE